MTLFSKKQYLFEEMFKKKNYFAQHQFLLLHRHTVLTINVNKIMRILVCGFPPLAIVKMLFCMHERRWRFDHRDPVCFTQNQNMKLCNWIFRGDFFSDFWVKRNFRSIWKKITIENNWISFHLSENCFQNSVLAQIKWNSCWAVAIWIPICRWLQPNRIKYKDKAIERISSSKHKNSYTHTRIHTHRRAHKQLQLKKIVQNVVKFPML